eukprot:CAMPEP_0114669386 /NCGR_PEP_ID=MMETSP0191-20121206/37989_1 /TAXON_ID=126664 /ORGANISM="Sorites sp." /LENGTH=73 /DNA_ID=CAMNT_0001924943 /DNA_START=21 /DNA_END=239 /DNA_ORIENTATION=+
MASPERFLSDDDHNLSDLGVSDSMMSDNTDMRQNELLSAYEMRDKARIHQEKSSNIYAKRLKICSALLLLTSI